MQEKWLRFEGGNGVVPCRGWYLEAAEGDHAVHHLGHTEAVPEIVEGVVSVIVVNAQLQREGMELSEGSELFAKHCISFKGVPWGPGLFSARTE